MQTSWIILDEEIQSKVTKEDRRLKNKQTESDFNDYTLQKNYKLFKIKYFQKTRENKVKSIDYGEKKKYRFFFF